MKRCLFAAALLTLQAAAWATGPSGYEVTGRIDIPGATHWDQVRFDAQAHRLYIAQSPIVTVLDTEARKVVGTVPDVVTAHDVAVDHDLNLGFVSAGRMEAVAVFDLDTLQKQPDLKSVGDPHSMLYDPRSKHLFVVEDRRRSIVVVDPKTRKTLHELYLDGPPREMVIGKNGTLFVEVMYDDSLVGVNPRTGKQVSRREFKQCRNPAGLVVDPKGRLYSACRNGKMVVSSPEGRTLQEFDIGDPRWSAGIDGAVWQDGHVFVSNGRNATLMVIDETRPDHFEVVETIPTERGARTLTGDPEHHRLYSVTADIDPSSSWDHPKGKTGSLHVVVIERR
jgi:hypothetical protein